MKEPRFQHPNYWLPDDVTLAHLQHTIRKMNDFVYFSDPEQWTELVLSIMYATMDIFRVQQSRALVLYTTEEKVTD